MKLTKIEIKSWQQHKCSQVGGSFCSAFRCFCVCFVRSLAQFDWRCQCNSSVSSGTAGCCRRMQTQTQTHRRKRKPVGSSWLCLALVAFRCCADCPSVCAQTGASKSRKSNYQVPVCCSNECMTSWLHLQSQDCDLHSIWRRRTQTNQSRFAATATTQSLLTVYGWCSGAVRLSPQLHGGRGKLGSNIFCDCNKNFCCYTIVTSGNKIARNKFCYRNPCHCYCYNHPDEIVESSALSMLSLPRQSGSATTENELARANELSFHSRPAVNWSLDRFVMKIFRR